MTKATTLPDDLTDEEARLACLFADAAVAEAERKAAIIVRVKREIRRHANGGHGIRAALGLVADESGLSVSEGVARDIWYERGAWTPPQG